MQNRPNYWLWVTTRENAAEANLNEDRDVIWKWTCDENTKKGDLILLYLNSKGRAEKGYHKSAFCYLMHARGNADRIRSNDSDWHEWRGYFCEAQVLYHFKNPVKYQDIGLDSELREWDAYKRRNFQGRSFPIPEKIWNKLDDIAMKRNPEYHGHREFLATQDTSTDLSDEFKAREYVSAFQNLNMAPHYRKMLLFNYFAPNRTLTATEMAKAMGYDHYTAANLHYGTLGRMVGEKLGWNPLPKYKVNVLVDFEKPDAEWTWIIKPAVAEAIELLNWTKEATTIPEEVDENEPLYEGATKRITVNAYERNPAARKKCLDHYGYRCTVCETILSDIYGEIAQARIHIHHLKPLSEINSEYQIDPIADLRPICPNCHAIIHLNKTPYSIEEVQELIKSQRSI
jgi:putative restriction endonuclease